MKANRPHGSVAVLVLAGGRGERLDLLTTLRAKPAVPFGGNFRIIDFVLSNCFNSGLTEVSILTQYLPRSLEDHVGFGRDWDLDRVSGGLQYLHPHRGLDRSNWYGGTANALYENLNVLEESRADHYLILSGDHIYRMDYRELVAQHEAGINPVTVGVRPVDRAQAHHFGLFETDAAGRVIDFAEKPAEPRSNLASMGIYVVRRQFLLDALRARGAAEPTLDFGRDLVPAWVAAGDLSIYAFPGYWLDVGTLESYVRAHQDLLGAEPRFQLADADWPLITHTPPRAPMHLAHDARALDALISEGCRIEGRVERSVLGPGVHVAAGALVRDAIVMEDCRVGPGCRVERCVVDKRVELGEGSCIGGAGAGAANEEKPAILRDGYSLLAKDSRVPAGWTLGRNVRWSLRGDEAQALARFPDHRVPDGASCLFA